MNRDTANPSSRLSRTCASAAKTKPREALRVRLAADAEQDLIDIHQYVAIHDAPEKASYVLDQLESLCLRLAELPTRGHVPPELDRIGVQTYREVHFKPYRVIYEMDGQDVFIHCILDGRRDIQSLLERRMLR